MLAGIAVLAAHRRYTRPVDALVAAGTTRATAYRRIHSPETFTWAELAALADTLRVPPAVLVSGGLAAHRWIATGGGTPPDGGGQWASTGSNREPTDSRPPARVIRLAGPSGARDAA
jgi:hypothetical protein